VCVYFGLNFIGIDLAGQLDEGKGLATTVADIKDANKRGALHFAAREGSTEVCKYLLEELKLDVDTKDEDGMRLISDIVCIYYFLRALFYIV
jgi:ankyrin repeat protein